MVMDVRLHRHQMRLLNVLLLGSVMSVATRVDPRLLGHIVRVVLVVLEASAARWWLRMLLVHLLLVRLTAAYRLRLLIELLAEVQIGIVAHGGRELKRRIEDQSAIILDHKVQVGLLLRDVA